MFSINIDLVGIKEPMNSKQIQEEAKNLAWRLTTEQMEKAIKLIQRLELAEITE